MNEKNIPIEAQLVIKEGVSKKTNKPYRMTFIRVYTGVFGDVDVLLDTNKDRAGILLDLLANN